jgi:hypothetical protein
MPFAHAVSWCKRLAKRRAGAGAHHVRAATARRIGRCRGLEDFASSAPAMRMKALRRRRDRSGVPLSTISRRSASSQGSPSCRAAPPPSRRRRRSR